MKELRDYKTSEASPINIAKAEKIRELIQKNLPEGDTAYCLMGIRTKTSTYRVGVRSNFSRIKPEIEKDSGTISSEGMSIKQKCLFGNLNNLSNPDILENYIDVFNIIDYPIDPSAKQLIMMTKTTNKALQVVLEKMAIIFRPYTDEEKAEYEAKLEATKAMEEFGATDAELRMMAAASF